VVLKIGDVGDNFLVDFNASQVCVGFQVLIMIMQQHWRVVHRRESNRWNANAANVAAISSAREDLDARLQSTEIRNCELIKTFFQGRRISLYSLSIALLKASQYGFELSILVGSTRGCFCSNSI
jgi:hypothetical protein